MRLLCNSCNRFTLNIYFWKVYTNYNSWQKMSNVWTFVILCIAFVCLSSLAKERSCRNFRYTFFLVFFLPPPPKYVAAHDCHLSDRTSNGRGRLENCRLKYILNKKSMVLKTLGDEINVENIKCNTWGYLAKMRFICIIS